MKGELVRRTGRDRLLGRRIYLRELRVADVGDDYRRWLNDPQVIRFLESRFSPRMSSDIVRYVRRMRDDPSQLLLAIVLRRGDRHIGNIKLAVDHRHGRGEVGILIGDRRCWGRGYATEAIGLVTEFAFDRLGLHRLEAGCYATNPASAKAFVKAGWRQEAVLPERWLSEGRFVDHLCLGMVRPR